MRENYDYLLDHPYEFPGHFMRFSRASYMPKSDLRFVMLLTVLTLSAMQARPPHPPTAPARRTRPPHRGSGLGGAARLRGRVSRVAAHPRTLSLTPCSP